MTAPTKGISKSKARTKVASVNRPPDVTGRQGAFLAQIQHVWTQHLPVSPGASPRPVRPTSSLAVLTLRQVDGASIQASRIKSGRYELVMGRSAPESDLVRMAQLFCVQHDELTDFLRTTGALPQDLPCRHPRTRARWLIDLKATAASATESGPSPTPHEKWQSLERAALATVLGSEQQKLLSATVMRYVKAGMSQKVMVAWARWRVQVTLDLYESRKAYQSSIPKPSVQLEQLQSFQTALHRVMHDISRDVVGTVLSNSSTEDRPSEPDDTHNAVLAVALLVLERLERQSRKALRKLEAHKGKAGAPSQPEFSNLTREVADHLGKFCKIKRTTLMSDAKLIVNLLGWDPLSTVIDKRIAATHPTGAGRKGTPRKSKISTS